MITVPTSTGSPAAVAPQAPRPDDAFLMMAAAQMHSEGRLVKSEYGEPDTTRDGQATTPPQPPPPPPERYRPSDGERGVSMMAQR